MNVLKCCKILNYFLGMRWLAWCIKGEKGRVLGQSINLPGIGDSFAKHPIWWCLFAESNWRLICDEL